MNTPPSQARPAGRACTAIAALLAAGAGLAFLVGGTSREVHGPPATPLAASQDPATPFQQSPLAPRRKAPPPEAVVVMGDGTRYTGLLVEQTDERIVLEIGGISLDLRRADVLRVDVLPPVLDRYKRMRDALPEDDIPGRLNLIEWLLARREFDAAAEEVMDVRRREPRNPRALELDRLIEAQRLLNAAPSVTPEPGTDPESDPADRAKEPLQVLSEEEINIIRVYELDLDHLPRVIIQRSTVERLLEEYRGDPLIPTTQEGRDDLFRAARSNPRRILEIIFRLKARHLYPQIQVMDNPRAMQMFRDRVHRTWLLNGCASCHNTNPDAPRGPHLITRRPNSDATVYSNYLILDRYRLPDGTPLINYDEPAKSVLLQMGMPRANADVPHPDVADARGWSPVFLSDNATSYQNAINWIRSMYRPRPEYPVDYPPMDPDAVPPAGPPVER